MAVIDWDFRNTSRLAGKMVPALRGIYSDRKTTKDTEHMKIQRRNHSGSAEEGTLKDHWESCLIPMASSLLSFRVFSVFRGLAE